MIAPDLEVIRGGAVMASFGERIRDERLRRAMSVVDLARASGLSETYIRNIERGTGGSKRPSLATIEALARALGMPFTELTGEEPPAEVDPAGEVEALIRRIAHSSATGQEARDLEEFLLMYWKLPPSVRHLMKLQATTYTDLARQLEKPAEGPTRGSGEEVAGI